jgi:hypothetical protein
MSGPVPLSFAVGPLLALFAPVAAMAAPIAPPVRPAAQAALLHPLTLAKVADMDFGYLAAPAAGTAVLDPVTNTMSVTGGVIRVGGTPHAARFAGATRSSSVVNIKVPNGGINITRVGGTEIILVDNFKLDGQSKRALAQAGVFEFNVGATLHPAANQVEGVYTGTFDVTIQYP